MFIPLSQKKGLNGEIHNKIISLHIIAVLCLHNDVQNAKIFFSSLTKVFML